jgi:hypothetical protein
MATLIKRQQTMKVDVHMRNVVHIQKNMKCKEGWPLTATLNGGQYFFKIGVYMKK